MVDVVFSMTCPACGEAYDASIDGSYVGRVRLRYGDFVARNVNETELLRITVSENGLYGCFYPDIDMRDAYLMLAAEAIARDTNRDGNVYVSIDGYYDYDNEWDFDLSNLGWGTLEDVEVPTDAGTLS